MSSKEPFAMCRRSGSMVGRAGVGGFVFALCCILTGLAVSPVLATDPAVPSGYGLVWQDDFNGTALNSNLWHTYYDGNALDNAYSVGNGNLTMSVYTDPVTRVNQWGRIYSQLGAGNNGVDGYEQKYGYFVARMKFQDKLNTSSAFYMDPRDLSDGTDPTISGAEIDIIEHWQQNATFPYAMANNKANFHVWGPGYATNVGHQTGNLGLDDGNFHLIALLWTPTSYKFYIDNSLQWTCTQIVSQQPEFFLFDTFVNNTQDYGPLGSPNNSVLTVDYVRAYAEALPGDANLDGKVDVMDLAILAANYRKHVTGGWAQGDFNNDGVVDVQDLALLAANYRHSLASDVAPAYDGLDAEAIELFSRAGVTVVPEPGAIVLLATGLLGLLAYALRKRK